MIRENDIKSIRRHWELYLIILLPLLYVAIFQYGPMYGLQIAFKDFIIRDGIVGSPWVGTRYFREFFGLYHFRRLIQNTLGISLLNLLIGFPAPIILAIAINEARSNAF